MHSDEERHARELFGYSLLTSVAVRFSQGLRAHFDRHPSISLGPPSLLGHRKNVFGLRWGLPDWQYEISNAFFNSDARLQVPYNACIWLL